ncbi:hypothetical protein [Altericroceibacterium endophyticum]|uniref:Uncharacterized protein n=1 Tax=Altericroceibacterium endophyticum TaxID=1808508 RepID=A0A6I4T5J4_9SPHN|nr:hypothetical protein [Altericroceibacterium endophyticum]MXO65958.1 hypothetical protein [Altericroceibacterium endophyticum]
MDIDAVYAAFLEKEKLFNAALARCEAEQTEGRTGLAAWREADKLNKELQVIARALISNIEQAIAELPQGIS